MINPFLLVVKDCTPGTMTSSMIDKWVVDFDHNIYPVPKRVRYSHPPRVCQSNPQMPRTRSNRTFRGHPFRVGKSKK